MKNYTSVDYLFFLAIAGIGIGISFLLVRWMWNVNVQTKQQRATIELLVKLCEKQGVTNDEIETIKNVWL